MMYRKIRNFRRQFQLLLQENARIYKRITRLGVSGVGFRVFQGLTFALKGKGLKFKDRRLLSHRSSNNSFVGYTQKRKTLNTKHKTLAFIPVNPRLSLRCRAG